MMVVELFIPFSKFARESRQFKALLRKKTNSNVIYATRRWIWAYKSTVVIDGKKYIQSDKKRYDTLITFGKGKRSFKDYYKQVKK